MSPKLINRIKKYTEKYKDKPQHAFKHLTFIIKRNKILAIGYCKQCTHPNSNTKYKYVHSEFHAIIQLSEVPPRFIVVNVRINNHGELRLSKPCKYCNKFLFDYNPRDIFYSNNDGEFQKC